MSLGSWRLAPDVAPDTERLVRIAEQGLDPKQRQSTAILALALYRAGRFDEAIGRLGEIADMRNPVSDLVLAMAHHRKGDKDKARESLKKAQTWYDEATRTALAASKYDLPHWHWNQFADFQILYREARILIEGTTTVEDKNAANLLARAREELARRDPLTADFDQALIFHPNLARLWVARGRRLAELGRFDEAEADFNKAVDLKPDDVEALVARASFHADLGDVVKAREEFAATLQLLAKDWWGPLGRVVRARSPRTPMCSMNGRNSIRSRSRFGGFAGNGKCGWGSGRKPCRACRAEGRTFITKSTVRRSRACSEIAAATSVPACGPPSSSVSSLTKSSGITNYRR